MPDPRLAALDAVVHADRIVPTTIDFVDIAGLVRGAHKGEGLGNQFLAHIREVDAVVQVARCFDDANVVHVENRVDPVADIDDGDDGAVPQGPRHGDTSAATARARCSRRTTRSRSSPSRCARRSPKHLDDGQARADASALPDHADAAGHLARDAPLDGQAHVLHRQRRRGVARATSTGNKHYQALKALADAEGAPIVPICAALEAQIAELDPADRPEFLASAGLKEPGLHAVVRTGFELLGLITFFTAGKTEVRAWTIRKGAQGPAGGRRSSTPTSRRASSRPRSSGGRTS